VIPHLITTNVSGLLAGVDLNISPNSSLPGSSQVLCVPRRYRAVGRLLDGNIGLPRIDAKRVPGPCGPNGQLVDSVELQQRAAGPFLQHLKMPVTPRVWKDFSNWLSSVIPSFQRFKHVP
jgi:hypothetical protein